MTSKINLEHVKSLEGMARLDAIAALDLPTADASTAHALGELAMFAFDNHENLTSLTRLATILEALRPALVDQEVGLATILPDEDDSEDEDDATGDRAERIPTESWLRQLIDPAAIELALSLGVPLRAPSGPARCFAFWLYRWNKREPNALDNLDRVGAHPYFGQVLIASFFPTRETKKVVGPWIARAVTRSGFGGVFAAIDRYATTLLDTFTLGAMELHEVWLQSLCQPPVLARCPSLAAALTSLTPARLLRNQLRGGLMHEWVVEDDAPSATERELDDLGDHPLAGLVDADAGDDLIEEYSYACQVDNAEASPLGGRDGYGGFALVRRGGEVSVRGLDGRQAFGLVNGKQVIGLTTFPARAGLYPVVEDEGVAMPDGTTPLVPADGGLDASSPYWRRDEDCCKELLDWYQLRPRNLAASAALAACTDAIAQALVDAAAPQRAPATVVMNYPGLQATLTPKADDPGSPSPAMLAAIAGVLPAVADPVLIASVASHAQLAATQAEACERLRSHISDDVVTRSTLSSTDVYTLARLFEHELPWWTIERGVALGQQMHDVAHYLLRSTTTRFITPAPTLFPWERLTTRIGEMVYRMLAPATAPRRRAELQRVVELWLETGLPDAIDRIQCVTLAIDASLVPGLDNAHPDRLVPWANRAYLRFADRDGDLVQARAIELLTPGSTQRPDGVTCLSEVPADGRFTASALRSALALFADRGPMPFDLTISTKLAAETGLSVEAATLLWTAGYSPWLVGDQQRARFHIDRDRLDLAEAELEPYRLHELYARAMPADAARAYDGDVLVEALAEAWLRKEPNG